MKRREGRRNIGSNSFSFPRWHELNLFFLFFMVRKLLSSRNVPSSCSSAELPASWCQSWVPPASPVLCAITRLQPVPSPPDLPIPSRWLEAGHFSLTFLLLKEYHGILDCTQSAIYRFHKWHFPYLGLQCPKCAGWPIWLGWKLAPKSFSLKSFSLWQKSHSFGFPFTVFQDDLLFSFMS